MFDFVNQSTLYKYADDYTVSYADNNKITLIQKNTSFIYCKLRYAVHVFQGGISHQQN